MDSLLEERNEKGSRRQFLRNFSVASAAMAIGTAGISGCSAPAAGKLKNTKVYDSFSDRSPVCLVKGTDRKKMIYDSMKPFESHLKEKIGTKQVLIKINCNRPGDQLIKTHPDAVRGVLEMVSSMTSRQILIGESTSGEESTEETYSHFDYYRLEKEYNAKMVELNDWPITFASILDRDLFPEEIGILNPFLDPDFYIISVAPVKTHNTVVVTLSLKNIVMGAPKKRPKEGINYKSHMHGAGHQAGKSTGETPKLINVNIFLLAHKVRPDFAVLDGFVGAEGDGPNNCDPVDHKVALSGPDFLAVDLIGSELMGVKLEKIGYLQWCGKAGLGQGDLKKIEIIGPDPKSLVIPYKLHTNINWQFEWDKPIDWGMVHPKKS
jgi:uncharacterized protein (DUF362 family)